jgi:hypothetical protein
MLHLWQVEKAMKRPKTEVDVAMENSPIKAKALLNEQVGGIAGDLSCVWVAESHNENLTISPQEISRLQQPSPLRTRLALQLSASKNV